MDREEEIQNMAKHYLNNIDNLIQYENCTGYQLIENIKFVFEVIYDCRTSSVENFVKKLPLIFDKYREFVMLESTIKSRLENYSYEVKRNNLYKIINNIFDDLDKYEEIKKIMSENSTTNPISKIKDYKEEKGDQGYKVISGKEAGDNLLTYNKIRELVMKNEGIPLSSTKEEFTDENLINLIDMFITDHNRNRNNKKELRIWLMKMGLI